MPKISYFETPTDREGNSVAAVAGTGATQTYNVTAAGSDSPIASLSARGPRAALSEAQWREVVPYTYQAPQVNPPVVTDSTRPRNPSPAPAQGGGLVPAMRPATRGKSFL